MRIASGIARRTPSRAYSSKVFSDAHIARTGIGGAVAVPHLLRLGSSSPGGADEDDQQAGEAPDRDVGRGPAERDELEQVRRPSHERHEQVGERKEEAEDRPRGPAAAPSEVSTATAAIATAAQTGRSPVANAIAVRTSPSAAVMSATRREIKEGPPEPAAAMIRPASAPSIVPLKFGRGLLSATPASRPAAM
jgi:hypothetical protein